MVNPYRRSRATIIDEYDCKPATFVRAKLQPQLCINERLNRNACPSSWWSHRSSASKTSQRFLLRTVLCALFLGLFFLPQSTAAVATLTQDARSLDDRTIRRTTYVDSAQPALNARGDTTASLAHRSALIGREKDYVMSNSHSFVATRDEVRPSLTQPSMRFFKRETAAASSESTCSCEEHLSQGEKIGFGFLVPILVLSSGVFAGLTLGYMSLDETQLQVLITTGDDLQRARARKIMPIRKDGHLLLTTLLIANMITNETLPIIFDPLLRGGVTSVIVSTVLIVIFSELIPQSTCSRYGLQIGAVMAFPTRIIMIIFWPVAYPVSRILHWVLGPHHGIVYRRAELKELVTMHAASGGRGGDLNRDTVMIVGGALDLQEKVVKQAMTPIDKVFMLPFTAKLDYATLEKVVRSGHSRIPIYVEVEVPVTQPRSGTSTPKRKLNLLAPFSRKNSSIGNVNSDETTESTKDGVAEETAKTSIRKKIIGTLLVKQCVLLDPEDAVPVSSMVINALPSVPGDEPLLNVLNVFQEGRSHMAIVSPRPRVVPSSVMELGNKSHLYHSSQGNGGPLSASAAPRVDGLGNIDEEKQIEGVQEKGSHVSSEQSDTSGSSDSSKHRRSRWRTRFALLGHSEKDALEQAVPSDATLSEKVAKNQALKIGQDSSPFDNSLSKVESHHSYTQELGDDQPIGIITLEDVLEELLCEEILDEYDDRGNEEQDFRSYLPPPSPEHVFKDQGVEATKVEQNEEPSQDDDAGDLESSDVKAQLPAPAVSSQTTSTSGQQQQQQKKTVLSMLGIGRQLKSASVDVPPTDRAAGQGLVRRNTVMDQIRLPAPLVEMKPADSYFAEPARISTPPLPRTVRSSSVPPDGERNVIQVQSPTEERPQTPLTDASIAAQSQSTQPLTFAAPQANRPIVVRTQMPGGQPKTVIAHESLLRGRPLAPSSAVGVGPSSQNVASIGAQPANAASLLTASSGAFSGGAALTPTTSSRSQTPVGANRGNRFKSQAATGVGAGMLATSSQGVAGPSSRSRSLTATRATALHQDQDSDAEAHDTPMADEIEDDRRD